MKHYDDFKVSVRYSNDMQDVYKDIEEYNPSKRHTVLIVFDDMIADMVSNKKLNPIVTEAFIRILNISLVFITQTYFKPQKDVRLNSLHYFTIKIPNEESFNKLQ